MKKLPDKKDVVPNEEDALPDENDALDALPDDDLDLENL